MVYMIFNRLFSHLNIGKTNSSIGDQHTRALILEKLIVNWQSSNYWFKIVYIRWKVIFLQKIDGNSHLLYFSNVLLEFILVYHTEAIEIYTTHPNIHLND